MKRSAFLPALLVLVGSTVGAMEPPHYANETVGSGVAQVYDGGWEFFVGGGIATFDCDADLKPDLYIAGGTRTAGLFRNESLPGGTLKFSRVSAPETDLPDVTGAYPIDIDGDGVTDLAVLRVGENVMLRGLGDCRFERANEAWKVDGGEAWTTGFAARWDGNQTLPTLVFANYVDRNQPGAPFGTCHDNDLFRPADDGGYQPPVALKPGYCALSALFTDWNRNGDRDLRLSNDRQYYRGGQEQMWRIPAKGTSRLFGRREGWRRLTIWGMGIATFDLDDDGYPDYFLTSMGDNKLRVLSKDRKKATYDDAARQWGLTAHRPYTGGDVLPSTAWHAEFRDVNNDSFIDLFIAKGNVEAMKDFAARDPNNLLIGTPDHAFVDAGESAGIVSFERSRGASLGDFNVDGLPDLVVVNRRANVEVWRNVGSGSAERPAPMGNWLQLRLRQGGSNRDAIGSWVEVRIGTRTLRREITIGGGHAGGHAGWIHFGVGTAERARVRVQWPDGEWSDWYRLYTNQFARITRGDTTAQLWLPPEEGNALN